jgi:uncharacterized protein involved in response to NO
VYRLAAAWAALAVPLWVAAVWLWPQAGGWPDAARSIDWHARAMVSGYVGAVVVAFLLAPARRWPADRGALAWALVAAWTAARLLSLGPVGLAGYARVFDLAFFGLAAAVLAQRAARAPVPNNLLFAAAPLVLMLSTVAPLPVLELVSVLVAVLAGRVIPGLVNARLRSRPARIRKEVERIALPALLAAVGLRAALPDSAVADLAAAFAALAHLIRWWGWAPLAAARADLRLAAMLAAYAWLPVWLLTAAASGWAPPGAETHALAAGLVGGMTWAMMNRTLAGDSPPALGERVGVATLVLAAVARFALPFAAPPWQALLVAIAAIAWTLAFGSLALRRTVAVPARRQ